MNRLATFAVAMLASAGVINTPAEAAAPNYNEACTYNETGWDTNGPADASLCYPLPPHTTVVIDTDGRSGVWRIRRVARKLDALVSGLTFVTDRNADCSAYPGAYCINIYKVWEPDTEKAMGSAGSVGWFTFNDYNDRLAGGQIYLNKYYGYAYETYMKKHVAYHELFHALGYAHHGEMGMMGTSVEAGWTLDPSDTEVAVMQGWYQ